MVSPLEPAPSGADHFVQFYDSVEQLLPEVVAFAGDALRSGGSAIVIVRADRLADVVERLGALVAAIGEPARRRVFVSDAEALLARFMNGDMPDRDRFQRSVGAIVEAAIAAGRPVHAFGEMVAVLCARGQPDAALRLEALWNELIERHRFSLYCGYPHDAFPGAEQSTLFRHVCALHRRVLPAASLRNDERELHLTLALSQQRSRALGAEIRRREDAERQRNGVLMHAPLPIALLAGPEHRIVLANHRFSAMCGRTDIVGRPLASVMPGADSPAVTRALDDARAHGVSTTIGEHRDRATPEGARVYRLHFNPQPQADGIGVIVSAVEVTEHVAAREKLQAANAERDRLLAELRDANHAKDQFLAVLGHELRNPLTPISLALELVRSREGHATPNEIAIIQRQLDHMVRLIDDLLDVSRITRGKIELKKEAVRIGDIVDRAVEVASPLLEQRRHRLHVDIDADVRCHGDPVRLSQVVANLLTNAAKYTAPGGDIGLHVARGDGDTIVIEVRDSGAGIPPDRLDSIFEPFFRLGGEPGRMDGGLGIGLALVKSFVMLHGGTVRADSAGPGLGSTFTVTLPEYRPPTVEADARELEHPPVAVPVGTRRRVLLVDDNEDAAATLAQWLRDAGHDVAVVHDPLSALGAFRSHEPDVAILDIGLPVMDGYELIRRLKAIETDKPCTFLALTGYGRIADRERCLEAGFRHHLVKPVDPAALHRAMDDSDPVHAPAPLTPAASVASVTSVAPVPAASPVPPLPQVDGQPEL
ncbi:hybrid sensor histidine kinase/response regulator [Burkholderia multivorans]|uniref:hybrid sensor histidine kinase/response regulator n=1 Tax=Burkholderia multivorans TaxID=87883 RepID=UPI000D3923D2|nr:ATP-binding protein [Burkholderia multivorans]MBR8020499.1 response regulator [Burkholderia multivorans]MCO1368750.1 ATP-binding protein [Burkholderia multivorans]MCO1380641.1 ATP-binding protein [Burkholderia multivorans]MDN8032496.1 ATP-binding protein [Burkholderia multivorans]MEB2511802.1 ATP-binding protein [Burkholderia multivorans]